jgi:hypothetical protein
VEVTFSDVLACGSMSGACRPSMRKVVWDASVVHGVERDRARVDGLGEEPGLKLRRAHIHGRFLRGRVRLRRLLFARMRHAAAERSRLCWASLLSRPKTQRSSPCALPASALVGLKFTVATIREGHAAPMSARGDPHAHRRERRSRRAARSARPRHLRGHLPRNDSFARKALLP